MIDPEKHLQGYIGRAADRYADGIMRGGLRRSERLERALADRAVKDALVDYEQQSERALRGNVGKILDNHRRRDREIRREGARMAWLTCPLAVLAFGLVAWYNFHQGDVGVGLVCAVGALAFLVLLVLAHRQHQGGR